MAIEWQVENIRLSLFSNTAVKVTEADWETLTGQSMADTRQAIPGGHVFTGRYQSAQLSIAGAGSRADIIMVSAPTELAEEPRLPTFGAWEETRDRFVAFTSKWSLGQRFPLTRIAFGAVLLAKADNKVEAYKHLKESLSSVTVDPQGMRDFLYRVNWPIESKIAPKLPLNRLTNWSALLINISRITLDGQGNAETSSVTDAKHAVRLEVDHSTDADRSEPFSAEIIPKLYGELVELASENATKGEKS